MTKNDLPNIADLLTAEFWVKSFAHEGAITLVPIQNFEFNILKANALHATSRELGNIWPKMLEKMPKLEL